MEMILKPGGRNVGGGGPRSGWPSSGKAGSAAASAIYRTRREVIEMKSHKIIHS